MCGIAGICRTDGGIVERATLERMAGTLRHRGPDDEGYYTAGRVGFGFRRLAILDLSPAGHQPMTNEDGTCWLVFNGEVYNYRALAAELAGLGHMLRSLCDAEVVLHAFEQWGLAAVPRLNGMFAFALWDERRQMLLAARDRFGIKPFYYHVNDDRLAFGSEIKALLAVPGTERAVNIHRLYDYLSYGYIDHTAETCFAGIRQLPAAHFLTFSQGRLNVQRYWALDPEATAEDISDAEMTGRFRELFLDSVRLHLQSDVPLGTCLSGGLDSSAIVGAVSHLMSRDGVARAAIGDRVRTFTSGFDDPRFDERQYADAVALQAGASPHYTSPDPADLFDLLPRLVWHQEEPFASTSIVAQWYVMQLARANGVTVMLDGQGGDEVLAGYPHYFSGLWARLARRADLPGLWREGRGYMRRHGKPATILLAGALGMALPAALRAPIQAGRRKRPPAWMGPGLAGLDYPWEETPTPYSDPLRRQMYRYLTTINLPSLLHYEDRNSMAFSIEARVPFLDYRLVEYAFALPARAKLRDGETKWLLRRSLSDLMPAEVTQRQDKMGFVTPETAWIAGPLAGPMAEIFASASFCQRPYWDAAQVRQALDAHVAGRADHHTLLWRCLNTELWLRQFIDAGPGQRDD